MELHIPKQLKFYKNDEETDFEIHDIDLSVNYHLMIAFDLNNPHNSVEIMEFKVTNYKSLGVLSSTCLDNFVYFSSLHPIKVSNRDMVILWETSDEMLYDHGNVMIIP